MEIIRAGKQDVAGISRIARQSFSVWKQKPPTTFSPAGEKVVGGKGEKTAEKWIKCGLAGYPKSQYFIAKKNNEALGYALWVEKGGFRQESVWELEQIAVAEEHRGQGIATELIKQSLAKIRKYVQERGDKIKLIEITTGPHQNVQRLYEKTLNAKPEAVIKDLFRGNEVIMIARLKAKN